MSPATSTLPHGHGRPRVSLPVLVIGLALAYAPSYVPGLLRLVGIEAPLPGPANVIIWNWLAVAALIVYVFRVEGLGWSSLRLTTPSEQDLNWAGYLGGGLMAVNWGLSLLLPPAVQEQAGVAQGSLIALGPLLTFGLVVTTAVTEEILWRGYAAERLAAWIGPWLASALGLAVFAASHVPFFGPGWLITGIPGSVMFYLMLAWRRNLWAGIVMHALGNSPIFLMSVVTALR